MEGDSQQEPRRRQELVEFVHQAFEEPTKITLQFADLPQLLDTIPAGFKAADPQCDMGRIGHLLDTALDFRCPMCGPLKSSAVLTSALARALQRENPQMATIATGPNIGALLTGNCPGCAGSSVEVTFDPTRIPGIPSASGSALREPTASPKAEVSDELLRQVDAILAQPIMGGFLSKALHRVFGARGKEQQGLPSSAQDCLKKLHVLLKECQRPAEVLRTRPKLVQIHDEKGETLLHYAASDGDVSLTKALIEHGADVNLKPLTMICLWNNSRSEAANREVADLLLAHGANLKMVEENGLSLLHLAAIIDVASAVRYLLKRGIDVNIRDGFGRTPLHLAAMKGNTKIIECLLDNGADPNAKDGDGRTPEEAGSVSRTQLAAFYSATIAKRIVERKGG